MINFNSPISEFTSYGIVGLNFLKELVKLNEISLFPIGDIRIFSKDSSIITECVDNAKKFQSYDSPCLRIFHQHSMAESYGKGKRYGMPIFELNGFSDLEKNHLSSLDEIIVNSTWAKTVIDHALSDKIPCTVIPLGVNTNIFSPKPLTASKPIFLNIGKMEYRKGHDFLIECFNAAFSPNDDVELWLLWENPFPHCDRQYWNGLVKNSPLKNKIRIIPRQDTPEQVSQVIHKSTCGIFPSRGEGFNLPALEMLSCGRSVIATNYSAHTEFLNNKNASLIEVSELEPALDKEWPQFNGIFEWAKLDEQAKEQTINLMREHAKQPEYNMHGVETAEKMTWQTQAEKLHGRLTSTSN